MNDKTDALAAPSTPGWYWHWDGEVFNMLFVHKRPGHEYLAVQEDQANGKRHFRMTEKMGGKWFGPIPTPLATPAADAGDGEVSRAIGMLCETMALLRYDGGLRDGDFANRIEQAVNLLRSRPAADSEAVDPETDWPFILTSVNGKEYVPRTHAERRVRQALQFVQAQDTRPSAAAVPEVDDAMVERAAKEVERGTTASAYGWGEASFEIWWTSDSEFVERTHNWGDFTGTRKERRMHETRIALTAALTPRTDPEKQS